MSTGDLANLQKPPVPPSYSGVRMDREWRYDGKEWTTVDTPKCFGSPKSFANTPLPPDTKLDAGMINGVPVNPGVAQEIQRQADAYGTYVNQAVFTAPITLVAPDQPLTPVDCVYNGVPCVSAMRQMMLGISPTGQNLNGGLPIPDDYMPADRADTDAEAVFYQPDYVVPSNQAWRGRFYEAWKLRLNPNFDLSEPVSPQNPRWTAASGGRVVPTVSTPGHYVNWTASGYQYKQPGHPDSTFQSQAWGVLATGLFIASDEISREDLLLGEIRHAVGLLMRQCRPGKVWPAQRSDGTKPSWNVVEGMRLRFPADLEKPEFTNQLASMVFDAAQNYGLVIDDTTNASIGVRVEPLRNGVSAPELGDALRGVAGYDVFKGFPWSKLQVLAVGSDATPNP